MHRARRRLLALATVPALVTAAPADLAGASDDTDAPADDRATDTRAARGGPSFSSPRSHLRLFAELNGGTAADWVYSREQALAVARRFDTVVALRWSFDEHVQAMKRVNPRLRIIAYMNGAMSKASDRVGMPEAWFLHGGDGHRIRNLHFDLTYMDVGNAGWRGWVRQRCRDWIRLSGFDGCFLDDMGSGNLGVNLSAWPIDPRTGRRMTERDWITYARGEQAVVREGNPGKLITSNGLNNGTNYFPPVGAGRMLDTAHGSMAEGWLRNSTAPATTYRTVDRWKQDVDMLVDAGRRGRTALVATKLWTSVGADRTLRWRKYAYGSFLLGTNGYSFLSFDTGGPGRADGPHPLDRFDPGTPQEHYRRVGRLYVRRFSDGLVVVNPTDRRARIELGGTYVRPDGTRVRAVTVRSYSAGLLRRPS